MEALQSQTAGIRSRQWPRPRPTREAVYRLYLCLTSRLICIAGPRSALYCENRKAMSRSPASSGAQPCTSPEMTVYLLSLHTAHLPRPQNHVALDYGVSVHRHSLLQHKFMQTYSSYYVFASRHSNYSRIQQLPLANKRSEGNCRARSYTAVSLGK